MHLIQAEKMMLICLFLVSLFSYVYNDFKVNIARRIILRSNAELTETRNTGLEACNGSDV